MAADVSNTKLYKLTCEIVTIKNATYGNLTVKDATGELAVQGLTGNQTVGANDQSFASLGLAVGDKITIVGVRQDYNGTAQLGSNNLACYFVEKVAGGTDPGTGGGETVSYKKATSFAAGKYLIVAETAGVAATKVAASSNYGYPGKTEVTISNDEISGSLEDCEFTFTATDGGYYIQQADGRYLYQSGTYNNFNLSAEVPASGGVFTVSIADGKATITNVAMSKYMQYSTQYNSLGCYASAQSNAEVPALYAASTNTGGGTDPGTDPGTGGGDTGGDTGTGSGTLADPYNIAGAVAYIDGGGTDNVYVKGKISAILYAFDTSHETASFWISDDGTAYGISTDKKSTTEPTKDFEAYGVKWLGNQQWAEGNSQPAVGDEVIIYGKLTKYNTTYETSNKNAYVYSWKGNTTDPNAGGGTDPGTGGGDTGGATVTLDLTAQGYANAAEFTSLTSSGVTMTGNKGTNSNAPKYYTGGNAIRFYGGNTFTISATKAITKITLTFGSSDGSNEITASPGTFSSPDWTGSSTAVTFTIGGTTGNRRISKVEVTLAE